MQTGFKFPTRALPDSGAQMALFLVSGGSEINPKESLCDFESISEYKVLTTEVPQPAMTQHRRDSQETAAYATSGQVCSEGTETVSSCGEGGSPMTPSYWDRQVPADGEHVGDKELQSYTACAVSLCPVREPRCAGQAGPWGRLPPRQG